jgi:hypothetical protein
VPTVLSRNPELNQSSIRPRAFNERSCQFQIGLLGTAGRLPPPIGSQISVSSLATDSLAPYRRAGGTKPVGKPSSYRSRPSQTLSSLATDSLAPYRLAGGTKPVGKTSSYRSSPISLFHATAKLATSDQSGNSSALTPPVTVACRPVSKPALDRILATSLLHSPYIVLP